MYGVHAETGTPPSGESLVVDPEDEPLLGAPPELPVDGPMPPEDPDPVAGPPPEEDSPPPLEEPPLEAPPAPGPIDPAPEDPAHPWAPTAKPIATNVRPEGRGLLENRFIFASSGLPRGRAGQYVLMNAASSFAPESRSPVSTGLVVSPPSNSRIESASSIRDPFGS